MTPLIAGLLKGGLGLLANAAMSDKGKAWIEEKTGIELAPDMSPEQLMQLKQFEMEHEEELLRIKQEDNRIEQEYFKLEVADRDSARDRDKSFTEAGIHNVRADLMVMAAFAIVTGILWLVWHSMEISEFAKGIVTLLLGRFLGYLDNAYSFEFGTTRGSRTKDSAIEQMSRRDGK
jgi:hypothetical protein